LKSVYILVRLQTSFRCKFEYKSNSN